MSNERDTQPGGSPVEETESTATQVQAAVQRAAGTAPVEPVIVSPPVAHPATSVADVSGEPAGVVPAGGAVAAEGPAEAVPTSQPVAPRVEPASDVPSAAASPTPGEIFAAAAASSSATRVVTAGTVASTEPNGSDEPVSSGASSPVRDGEIRISADHPMATLYMQTPMPPDPRGNRVAGFWISLLASLTFAVVYAGCIALVLTPSFPPSTYLTEGLVPALLAPSYLIPVVTFVLASIVLALIAGRSGWWAHIIGSFFVGGLTAAATGVALLFEAAGTLTAVVSEVQALRVSVGVVVISFLVGILAREVSVWYGAWIGTRGRKITKLNSDALDEYEAALADVQNTQVSLPAQT